MEANGKNSRATKALVLEAACDVFAREGYHEGTVAKICEAAGANRAAVNYYFGDKENLYCEVWKHALAAALEAYPLQPKDGNPHPEERLRIFMRSLLLRAFDPGPAGRFTRLMAFEITEPQGFLRGARARVAGLHDAYFESLMRELLGTGTREEDLVLCRLMVLAPSLGVGLRRFARHARHMPHATFEFDPERMAERMFDFALAGIERLRRDMELREAGVREDGEGAR
ncbi:MAG: TetR/AcrR family transcriptional regulator [Candidatus Eisenbacteria bacterium]